MIFLPLKESLTLFQIWNFFVKRSFILSQLKLLREEFTKLIEAIWWDILTLSFVLAYQFLFLYVTAYIRHSLYKAWLFEKFIFDLESSSCILLRQVISSKKMVMLSAKFTNLIPWSPICTAFILLLALVKLASTSATIIYNTKESGDPWQTPCIRVKRSDRRPFISILDWMLVYATLMKQMNFSPYPNFCKTEKTKFPIHSTKDFYDITERLSFSLFGTLTTSQITESVCKIVLFLIAADYFSVIIVTEAFCMPFLRILG